MQRVFSYFEIIKHQPGIHYQFSHGLSHAFWADLLDGTNRKAPNAAYVFWAIFRSDSASVFIIVLVRNIEVTVFNAPVSSIGV